MQISTIRNILLASIAVGVLAACETTTTVDEEDPPLTCDLPLELNEAEDACVLPPPPPVVSSNGLRFADGKGLSKDDFADTTLTLRAARLIVTGDEGDKETASAELIDLDIISSVNEGNDWIIVVDFGDGETLLVDTTLDYCPTSTTGIRYCFDKVEISDNVGALVFHGHMGPGEDWDYRVVGAFIGLETDPDILGVKGSATYEGGFGIELASTDENFKTEVGGGIYIDADFVAGDIEGDLSGGGWDVDFAGEIDGNGWNATANEEDSDIYGYGGLFEMVDGEFQLDGVFYGATAEETAGTILLDAEVSYDDDPPFNLIGVGGFYAREDWD